ncbi:MAG: heme-binding domain-containing protein [Bacteroidota bacterium]
MKKILKKITLKKVIVTLFVIFIVIQAFRIDTNNPPVDPAKDFIAVNKPTQEVVTILKNACYDCHSNESVYPWYSNIAPVSWWLKDHINEARHELNFSEWTTYPSLKQDKKLRKSIKEIEEGGMPLDSYTWIHKNAILNKVQQKTLTDYLNSLRTHEADKNKDNHEHEEHRD